MLRASFVRVRGNRDRIYARRSDGSEVSWVFPSYGDGLPHDLVHLVVEDELGLDDGFWGRVDAGADPARVNAEANRRGGRDKYAAFGADRRELLVAEALAAALTPREAAPDDPLRAIRDACAHIGVEPPALTRERVDAARARLAELAARWRALGDIEKGTIELTFERGRFG